MKLITLYIPEPYIAALDELVEQKLYPNRAEAIRIAIRDLLKTEVWAPLTDEETEPDSIFSAIAEGRCEKL